jgi:hypothetical protein
VVQAILLDPEARQDAPAINSGRLRDPLGHVISVVRALNGNVSPTNGMAYLFVDMGQSILTPNSVFNWFSPLFKIPKTSLQGPEFQIYSPTEAVLRANFIYNMITSQYGSDVQISLAPFQAVAGNTTALIDAVDQALFYGRMSPQVKASIAKGVNATNDNNIRTTTALHLAATSGEYLIQH